MDKNLVPSDLVVPETVNGIQVKSFSFKGCTSLVNVTIPDSITKVPSSAFQNCTNLKGVVLGNETKSIESKAFFGCTGLETITLPDTLTRIGNSAFYECQNLKSITFPDALAEIGTFAFSRCEKLESITIPSGVKVLKISAFSDCMNLAKVTLSEGVEKIEESCFNSSMIEEISIPASLLEVGRLAFEGGYTFVKVYIQDVNSWCSIDFNCEVPTGPDTIFKIKDPDNPDGYIDLAEVQDVDFSSGDKVPVCIPPCTFCNCTKIGSMTIPSTVIWIGEKALAALGLKTITVEGEREEVCVLRDSNALRDSIEAIYVPESMVSKYQEAENWSVFADKIKAIPTNP